jgi:type VI secretion system protein ImpJ
VGFQTLGIDRESMAGGHLAIVTASGILSDGLLFDFPEAVAAPEPKSLAGRFASDDNTVDFYSTIPHYHGRSVNVAPPWTEADTRYRAATEMVPDENTGLAEKTRAGDA